MCFRHKAFTWSWHHIQIWNGSFTSPGSFVSWFSIIRYDSMIFHNIICLKLEVVHGGPSLAQSMPMKYNNQVLLTKGSCANTITCHMHNSVAEWCWFFTWRFCIRFVYMASSQCRIPNALLPTLRLKSQALIVAAPPCSMFGPASSSQHCRTWDNPLGNQKWFSVRLANRIWTNFATPWSNIIKPFVTVHVGAVFLLLS